MNEITPQLIVNSMDECEKKKFAETCITLGVMPINVLNSICTYANIYKELSTSILNQIEEIGKNGV